MSFLKRNLKLTLGLLSRKKKNSIIADEMKKTATVNRNRNSSNAPYMAVNMNYRYKLRKRAKKKRGKRQIKLFA